MHGIGPHRSADTQDRGMQTPAPVRVGERRGEERKGELTKITPDIASLSLPVHASLLRLSDSDLTRSPRLLDPLSDPRVSFFSSAGFASPPLSPLLLSALSHEWRSE